MAARRAAATMGAMSFLTLVLKNLFRQRVRTALTLLGISIGITTVVTLGVVLEGAKSSSSEFLRAGGADFMVAQEGASDLSFSAVAEREWRAIAARPDVARATGVLFEVADVGSNPFFFLFGYDPASLSQESVSLVAGRLLAAGQPDEALLGVEAAKGLEARVGGTVVLDRKTWRVVGIYRTGERWRDAGAIVPLEPLQQLAGKTDVVTAVHVVAARGVDPDRLAAAIERDHPQLAAIVSTADFGKVDRGFEIMDGLNLAISILAVGIGAIGVMNTMIMSVFERTREIGILRAVGWRGSRILRMVVLESLLLCLLAAAIGVLLGVLASRAVLLAPAVSAILAPSYEPAVFARAVGVGVAVALMGAVYPAFRAVRLSPMEALRHE
jgi:putative ABC transport system permease protein